MDSTKGLIIKSIGGLYSVKSPLGIIECKARGIFRKQNISPCVGDEVIVSDGVISEIMPRKNELIRPPLANLDYMIFVVSTCEPSPNFLLLDKFIAICVFKGINPLISVTKSDIKADDSIARIYKNSGAEVFTIDYSDENSLKPLYDKISGKLCAFTGNTGVGKSTLLNHLDTETVRATGEISQKLGRGRHTTRHVEMFELRNGALIADTPGFSTFETNKYDIILKDKLAACFNEFDEFTGKCRFPDCSHTKEKGCAVIEAVNNGLIPKSRHESYIAMYEEAKQIKEWEIGK
ncbi:MAG: ribosome small subunit-dependent GTPase A [Oscillospiraceae bacterium]